MSLGSMSQCCPSFWERVSLLRRTRRLHPARPCTLFQNWPLASPEADLATTAGAIDYCSASRASLEKLSTNCLPTRVLSARMCLFLTWTRTQVFPLHVLKPRRRPRQRSKSVYPKCRHSLLLSCRLCRILHLRHLGGLTRTRSRRRLRPHIQQTKDVFAKNGSIGSGSSTSK